MKYFMFTLVVIRLYGAVYVALGFAWATLWGLEGVLHSEFLGIAVSSAAYRTTSITYAFVNMFAGILLLCCAKSLAKLVCKE